MKEYSSLYKTPFMTMEINCSETALLRISKYRGQGNSYPEEDVAIIRKVKHELDEYFESKRKSFDIPIDFNGTEFQKRVWKALLEIPYAQTRSYKEIAQTVDNPKAYRAVGQAVHVNPIVIIVPCHRVIGANGSLTGFSYGISMKRTLLKLEKETEKNLSNC